MVKKRVIRAVQTRDLDEFLKNAGLWDDLVSGNLECSQCNRKLSKSSIKKDGILKLTLEI